MGRQSKTMNQPKVLSTEKSAKGTGYRLGYVAALTTQRIQEVISSLPSSTTPQMYHPQISQQEDIPPTKAQGEPVIERAETLIDQMGQRLSHIGTFSSLRIQQITARVRENIEDMWAEAQHISHQGGNKSE